MNERCGDQPKIGLILLPKRWISFWRSYERYWGQKNSEKCLNFQQISPPKILIQWKTTEYLPFFL